MRNVIGISTKGENFISDSLTNTNDGSNSVVLMISCNTELHPILMVENNKIEIMEDNYLYELPESMLYGTGNICFTISDDKNASEFTISRAEQQVGNLFLKKVSEYTYKLSTAKAKDKEEVDLEIITYSAEIPYKKQVSGLWGTFDTFKLPPGKWLLLIQINVQWIYPCIVGLFLNGMTSTEDIIYGGRTFEAYSADKYSSLTYARSIFSTSHSLFLPLEENREIKPQMYFYQQESNAERASAILKITALKLG